MSVHEHSDFFTPSNFPAQHSREAVKIIASPYFPNDYDELEVLDTKHLKAGAVVRNKEDRELLHGYEC
ncbi:unnamed protein product [Anisakis simplex]|uniref:tRNA-synt_1c_C domain-containing protein n=1 Tax=Anisakis simplex TaxID=6269 RepID=A0A0M3K8F7_ANISI|nr:unnamed protein product [Anisakis simplex]